MYLTHGDSKIRFYNIWSGMKNRCSNENNKYYQNGIQVNEEWKIYQNFKKDMHDEYLIHVDKFGEHNTTIERIDTNGNYEKSNCKWDTYQNQARNRNSNIFIYYQGEKKCVEDIAIDLGIKSHTLIKRFKMGWDINEALTKGIEIGKRSRSIQEKYNYNNQNLTINEWAEITKMKPSTIRNRIKRGWSVEKALITNKLNTTGRQ